MKLLDEIIKLRDTIPRNRVFEMELHVEKYQSVVSHCTEVPADIRAKDAKETLAKQLRDHMLVETQYSVLEDKFYTRASIRVVKER